MTFLIQKITKQDKETIDKGAKEVPESGKTVCRESESVRGCVARGRGFARVFCSFTDTVAVMLESVTSVHWLMFAIISRRFPHVTAMTLRKPARQNSVHFVLYVI